MVNILRELGSTFYITVSSLFAIVDAFLIELEKLIQGHFIV